jgi:monoamine oxidase
MSNRNVDVVVVGAGLSGLSAAYWLEEAGKSVVLIEANDRIGGRMFSMPITGISKPASFDMGAAYMGKTQTALISLAKQLGINMDFSSPDSGLISSYDKGEMLLYWNKIRKGTDPNSTLPIGGFGPLAALNIADLFQNQVQPHVQALADPNQDYVSKPWEAPQAEEWDKLSVEDWLASNRIIDEDAKGLIRVATQCVWSAEAHEISFLYFIWYMACAGTLDVLLNCHGDGAQAYRFKDGAQNIAELLCERLQDKIEIVMNQPVHTIETSAEGTQVLTASGDVYCCKDVVVAMSPFMSSRINYSPALPDKRVSLVQRMPIGRTVKCIASYDKPFWREKWCGMAISNCTYPVWTMDDTTAEGTFAMMAFVVGEQATAFTELDPQQREKTIIQSLVEIYGMDEFNNNTGYVEKDWNAEPWAWGCPVGMMAPGALTHFGTSLREPTGAIHWAGTETATQWQGYMNGAIVAGQRAASEIIEGG